VRKSESLSLPLIFLNFVLVEVAFFLHFRVSIFKFFLVSFFPPFLFKNNKHSAARLFETHTNRYIIMTTTKAPLPENLLQDNTNVTPPATLSSEPSSSSPRLKQVPSSETLLCVHRENARAPLPSKSSSFGKDLNFETQNNPKPVLSRAATTTVATKENAQPEEQKEGEEEAPAPPPAAAPVTNFMDDSDDELTEEQKRVIAERIAALQNRFKKFEEKSLEVKIEELVMQHGHLNLNEKEALMILKVCEMNELDAEERLRRVNDLYQDVDETPDAYLARILDTETGIFLTQIRDMVMEEEYAKKVLQKNKKMRKISEQRIARKIKRLSNKKVFDEDGNEIVDSDLEAWEEYDNEQFFEEYVEVPPPKEEKVDLGPMLGEDGKEMVIAKDDALDGVKFVRHERKAPNGENLEKGAHTTARLKLDDAVARANAVMEAQMKAREEKREAKEAKRLAKLAEEEAAKKKEEAVEAERKSEDVAMEVAPAAVETGTAGEEKKPVDETTDATKAASTDPMDVTTTGTDAAPAPAAAAVDDDDSDDSDDDIEAPLEIDESELFAGWSEARIKGWKNRIKKPNAYYYRFNAPGERQSNGGWTPKEHELFMETLAKLPDGKANYEWGTFSISIPGRVGYQCSNYYRSLVKNGVIQDENYMLDEKGELRFHFKNKGFDRTTIGTKPPKAKPPPKPKKPKMRPPPKIKAPKMKKPKKEPKKKKKKDEGDDDTKGDKTFRCSVKTGEIRRSSRNAGKERRKYSEGGEGEDGEGEENEDDEDGEDQGPPVLPPGFLDPITRMQIEEPAAISPYGHVAGYETWCQILRNPEAPDTCPFTRQSLKRRQLVKLTHENIAEYLDKMVDVQQMR